MEMYWHSWDEDIHARGLNQSPEDTVTTYVHPQSFLPSQMTQFRKPHSHFLRAGAKAANGGVKSSRQAALLLVIKEQLSNAAVGQDCQVII